LLAALFHAVWNALVKTNADRLSMMAWIGITNSLAMLPLIPFTPWPTPEVWHIIFLSLLFHIGYKLFLVQAYTHGDYGQVYPLARGLAPAFITAIGFLFLGEQLSLNTTLAIALIVLGIISLAWRKAAPGAMHQHHGVYYAIGTALFIAAYTLNDALGGRTAASPHIYIIWSFLLDGVLISAVAWWRRGAELFRPRKEWLIGGAGGLLSLTAYWIIIWAMSVSPVGPVAALRETSVVIAALISGYFMKEGLGARALIATCIVASGIVLLKV